MVLKYETFLNKFLLILKMYKNGCNLNLKSSLLNLILRMYLNQTGNFWKINEVASVIEIVYAQIYMVD